MIVSIVGCTLLQNNSPKQMFLPEVSCSFYKWTKLKKGIADLLIKANCPQMFFFKLNCKRIKTHNDCSFNVPGLRFVREEKKKTRNNGSCGTKEGHQK